MHLIKKRTGHHYSNSNLTIERKEEMKTNFYYPVAGLLLLLLSLSTTTWGATSSSPTIETVNGFLSDIEIENVLSQFQGMGRRLGDYGGAENNNVGTFMLGVSCSCLHL